ncbi:ferritin-like domain-containing protein [Rufibacter roseus]|uniref:Ferritin-like domain-containing protein n=1 Tax=Rufibacter roseus TaxID=1567108 RepID=A0ABW2DKT7_9BACT|nr:ferritin-like domain-containing protein [Rufibacter roseus]
MIKNNKTPNRVAFEDLMNPVNRRNFIRYTGIGMATTAVLLTGCGDDDEGGMNNMNATLTNNDTGILNFAYALEQLEAAFYTKVIATPYANMSTMETNLLKDIRDHEIAHRDFFKAALGSDAIGDLQVDFSAVNFNDRNSVLTTARTFEDLGVSAYNGAGNLISNADYLVIAGKIVSVEARHAAWIRDMLSNGTFSDSANAQGLDPAMMPSAVLQAADPFITTTITSQLP